MMKAQWDEIRYYNEVLEYEYPCRKTNTGAINHR